MGRKKLEKGPERKKILDAAGEILTKEGYGNLSIRKIAGALGCSNGIIYYYFKNKEEIISAVIEEGYSSIIRTITQTVWDEDKPDKSIEEGFRAYIRFALENANQYKAVLFSDIVSIQEKVGILQEGISHRRKSMEVLSGFIARGIESGKFRELDAELTAQILWTSTFGLLSRLLVEKDITETQKERLIKHTFQVIFKGILR